jgi:hypothetical protein
VDRRGANERPKAAGERVFPTFGGGHGGGGIPRWAEGASGHRPRSLRRRSAPPVAFEERREGPSSGAPAPCV